MMHEMSIAQNIIDVVRDHLPAGNAAPVRTIRLRIGELADVLPESLALCFEAMADKPPVAGAKLIMERVPVRASCCICGETMNMHMSSLRCRSCGSIDVRIVSGMELQVIEIELDDEREER